MKLAQYRLNLKLWQRENENWRTDFTDIDNDIKDLKNEIKAEQDKAKWNDWFDRNLEIPKKVKIGIVGKEYDYDELRESEEATEIALSNLEKE